MVVAVSFIGRPSRKALQHALHRVRVLPKVGQIEVCSSAVELRTACQREGGTTLFKEVPRPFWVKISIVGLSCIVVCIEMAEVIQLLETSVFVALNMGAEPCRD